MLIPPLLHQDSSSDSSEKKSIAVFGSTGSVGCSTVDLLQRFPDRFSCSVLVGGSNRKVLLDQVLLLKPKLVVAALPSSQVSDSDFAAQVLKTCPTTEIAFGEHAVVQAATDGDYDVMVAAIVGMAGLASVFAATKRGKKIALANKESLVCAGSILSELRKQSRAEFLTVDSEHSALWQALLGNHRQDVANFILTASGGAFLNYSTEQLQSITVNEALIHPNWTMGKKITIDSSNLMNKALELIEAHWLFDAPVDELKVIIHPQSIVHSIIEFKDGGQLWQTSVPDMRGAISFALSYPGTRLPQVLPRLDLATMKTLQFFEVNEGRFTSIRLAKSLLQSGTSGDAVVFNAADEVAVQRFLDGRLSWASIPEFVETALNQLSGKKVSSFDDVVGLDSEVRSTLASQ